MSESSLGTYIFLRRVRSRISLFKINAVVGVTIRTAQRTAAQTNTNKKGQAQDVEVLHDGLMWILERHTSLYAALLK